MKSTAKLKALLPIAMLACLGSVAAHANQIVLEGSDATAFHEAGTYTNQLFTFMQTSSPWASKPVLILGGVALSGLAVGQGVLAPGYSLSGYTLSDYSGLYVESVGGCCTQADTSILAGDQGLIAAAEALGMSLSIENYGGGPKWGAMLPAAVNALASGNFGGITDYGTAGGPTCTDGEVFNSTGTHFGFTQPAVLSCYEHQGYRTSAFTPLGFVSLVNADPAYFGTDGSALLAYGGVLGTPVPEPTSIALLGLGLAGLAASRKRKAKAA